MIHVSRWKKWGITGTARDLYKLCKENEKGMVRAIFHAEEPAVMVFAIGKRAEELQEWFKANAKDVEESD